MVKKLLALLTAFLFSAPAFASFVYVPAGTSGGGSGTVTNFSAGNLNPLFTTSVATPTTTPILSFLLSNAAANSVFGRNNATAGAPAYFQGTVNGTFLGISAGLLGFYTPPQGTVTNFTAGNLNTWFTTSVANPTTAPALTFNPTGSQGDIPFYSALNTAANLAIGTNGYVLTSNGTTPYWAPGGGGGSSFIYGQDPGGRLTAVSGQPVPIGDIVGFPTQAPTNHLYYTPYTSDLIPLWTGSAWEVIQFTETSINVPNDAPFDIDDVFAYDSGGGVLALELDSWNAGGVQTWGTITSTTAAQPCTIFGATGSFTGITLGDLIGIYGGSGSLYNDPYAGIQTNAKVWVVGGVTIIGDNVILDDSNTTGLTDSTDGYWVLIPSTRAVPLSTQNGRLVKGTDPTRLYLGTIMPGLSVSPD